MSRTILFFPPVWRSWEQPYLSVPTLAGYLESHSIGVDQVDLNLEYLVWLARDDNARVILESSSDVRFEEWAGKDMESKIPIVMRCLAEAIVGGKLGATNVVDVLSSVGLAKRDPAKFIRLAMGDTKNQFREFGDEFFRVNQYSDSDYFCFSIGSVHQALSTLTFASIVRRKYAGSKIVFGGNWISLCNEETLLYIHDVGLCDYFVKGEGEKILLDIVTDGYKGDIIAISSTETSDLLQSLPDFGNAFELRDALGVKSAIPIEGSRGCYWGRCRFCGYSFMKGYYKSKTIEQITKQVCGYNCSYPGRGMVFVDDCMSKMMLLDIARALCESGMSIDWATSTRADFVLEDTECEILRKSGCRKIWIGVESGSSKVLSLMDKGIRLENATKLIGSLSKHEIVPSLTFMVGFPGEDEGDLNATLRMIDSLPSSCEVKVAVFSNAMGSRIYSDLFPNVDNDIRLISTRNEGLCRDERTRLLEIAHRYSRH